MRVAVTPTILAHPGEVIRVRARFPKKIPAEGYNARLGIWSRTPGYEYSPHIQIAAMGLLKDGKPEMVPPMRITLSETSPVKEISFVADDELEFCVRQDVDVAADPQATVKIKKYSMRTFSILRRIEKAFKSIWFRAKGLVMK